MAICQFEASSNPIDGIHDNPICNHKKTLKTVFKYPFMDQKIHEFDVPYFPIYN